MQLGLLITQRCNAACAHCSTSCGPDKSAALDTATITRLMDEAAQVRDGRPLVFSISGGEPFLDFEQLTHIVAHGAGLGAEVTCMSNGYWASSDEKAELLLGALKRAGLTTLGVSTSRYHRRFVKVERVKRALTVAVSQGIAAVLKYVVTPSEQREAEELGAWATSAGAKRVEIFNVVPHVRERERLPENHFTREAGLPRGRCPNATLTLRENGVAYSCCTPGGFVEFLSLGSVTPGGLRATYHRFLLQGKQKLLRGRGPIHFARAARKRGLGHLLRDSYAGVCDLCTHIATEPRLAQVAEELAAAYQRRTLPPLLAHLVPEPSPAQALPRTRSKEARL